jgi:hypothetical protein
MLLGREENRRRKLETSVLFTSIARLRKKAGDARN